MTDTKDSKDDEKVEQVSPTRAQGNVVHETRTAAPAREIRSMVGGEIRAVEGNDNQFVARVCNYGVPDTYRTSWKPGVFTRSLQQKLPKAVWSHDWNRPIGKVISYEDGPEGLDVTVQLAGDYSQDAVMARGMLRDGIVDQFSFGFVRVADEPDPSHRGVTRITDVDLDEISPVLVGSVPGTRTLSVRSDEQVEARAAADILVRFERGELDLADALATLKGAGTRTVATEADLPKNVAGGLMTATKRAMKRTPHAYKASNGDGSVCATCGGQNDIKAHTRAQTPGEIRDLTMSISSDALGETDDDAASLVAATDAAIDAAISLASYQDLTQLPWWVAQMVALVMAADTSIDAAMVMLGVPDPDEQVTDGMVRSIIADHEVPEVPAVRAPESDELELRLARLGQR